MSVVEHLSNLVRIPSVSSMSNRPVIDYVESTLRAQGWTTTRLEYTDKAGISKCNLIAAPAMQDVTNRQADLAFVCHTDTVPYSTGWTKALTPHLEGGNLHGCGACDVKGFLACLLTAADAVETHASLSGLRILFTADEEVGCVGAANLIAADVVRPKRVVIGEPTSLQVARAGKGYCLAKVTVKGAEAHSAYPDRGASAIYSAARLIRGIEEFAESLAEERHNFFDPGFTTINVGTIEGGTAKNVVPGQCQFLVEWRPIPGQAADRVLRQLHELAGQLRQTKPRVEVLIEPIRLQPGFETAEDASLVALLSGAAGQPARSISFSSEASLFCSVADEVVVFGPGDMRTAHSERECVPVSELDAAVRLLTRLMRA